VCIQSRLQKEDVNVHFGMYMQDTQVLFGLS